MKREETSLPNTEFVTATGRYDESRLPIDLIVLHSTAGTLQSAISLFGLIPQAGKETSAHYIVDNDGKLYQGLEEYFTAYHCGNYNKNQRSIGIEHVDNGANVKLHTDAQYDMSCQLVADICKFYNIPCDSTHIVPHNSITSTACPNGLDVNRIIAGAKNILGVVVDCPAKLAQITAERDRLNGIIEGKDDTIKHLGDTIDAKNAEIAVLNTRISGLEQQVLDLTSQLSSCQEQAVKVPDLTKQVDSCEKSRAAYMGQVSKLQEQLTKIKGSLVPKKYLSKKIYDFIMTLE